MFLWWLFVYLRIKKDPLSKGKTQGAGTDQVTVVYLSTLGNHSSTSGESTT